MNSLFYSHLLTVEMAMDDIYIYIYICVSITCVMEQCIHIYIYTRSADLTLPLTHSVIRLQSVRGPRDSTSTLEALAAWKAEPHGG